MRTKLSNEIVICPLVGTGSQNYSKSKGSTKVLFATLSEDFPLEPTQLTGRSSKTPGRSCFSAFSYWIYFTSLIRSNKLKINFNDPRIVPYTFVPEKTAVFPKLGRNSYSFTDIPLSA